MSSISQIYASIKDVVQPAGEIIGLLICGIVIGIVGGIKKKKLSFKTIFAKDQNFVQKHTQIHELLTELRLITRSSRSLIFQFHNGGSFKDGSSMNRFSVTHESIAPGIQSMILESQDVLVTRYMELIRLLKSSPHKIISVESLSESSLQSGLMINNVMFFSVSPLRCVDSLIPLGFICCHWCSKEEFFGISEEGIDENVLSGVIETATKTINTHMQHIGNH